MEESSPNKESIIKESNIQFSYEYLTNELSKRANTAFNVALKKLLEKNGSIELVLQTGEAFGRGLFAEFIKEKPEAWTIENWFEITMESILEPMGHSFTIAQIKSDEARSLMTRSLLQEYSDENSVVFLFTYGFIRGLLLSAFPKGELIMGSTMNLGDPVTEFTFKTMASYNDRFERQRVKKLFITSKKL